MGGKPLRPLDMRTAPVPFQERYRILQKLLAVLEKLKPHAVGRLNKLCMTLEYRVAKSSRSAQSYHFNLSVLIRDLNKNKGDLEKLLICGKPLYAGTKRSVSSNSGGTVGRTEVLRQLEQLLVDPQVLKLNGYIMDKRTKSPNLDILSPYVTCERCNTKFEKHKILEDTLCRFHVSKKHFNRETKLDEYPCCGENILSTSFLRLGCKTCKHHVFRSMDYEDLCTITEFSDTFRIDGVKNVLSIDCEMGFTSLGYELIRLTIVDFFTSKVLFDEVVQPIGQVIDLNSAFSGVLEIDRTRHLTYQQAMDCVLNKQLINKNSILIGHGFENDLNVMRLIHNRVIDTAILYNRSNNVRFKPSLKNLAFEHLSRRIQNGAHDSSEDAIATMDIIKMKIGVPLDKKHWVD